MEKKEKRVTLTFRLKASTKKKIRSKARAQKPKVTTSRMTETLLEKAISLSEI